MNQEMPYKNLQFNRSINRNANIIAIPLVFCVFMLRPSIVGGHMSLVGAIGIIVCYVFFFLLELRRYHSYWSSAYNVLGVGCLLMLYLLVQAALCNSTRFDVVMQIFVVNSTVLWCLCNILAHKTYNRVFYKFVVFIFSIIGLSSCLTTVLFFFGHRESLLLFSFPVRGYQYTAEVYFPFSTFTRNISTDIVMLSRFGGVFREPGIFQAFSCWAIVYAVYYKCKNWIVLGLIASVITTYSTAGILNLVTVAFGWLLIKCKYNIWEKMLLVCVATFALLGTVYYFPYIGIRDKSATYERSIYTRIDNARMGLATSIMDPIGEGYYNVRGNEPDDTNINLLAASQKIGLIGAMLVLSFIISPLFTREENVKIKLLSLLPIISTLLFSQPLFDQPLIYIVLLSAFETNVSLPVQNSSTLV